MTSSKFPTKDDPSGWSESRAADRHRMARHIAELAEAAGASTEVAPAAGRTGAFDAVQVRIRAPGGLRVTVELARRPSRRDAFVLNWNMEPGAPGKLRPAGLTGSVNAVHFRKATGVAHDFVELCDQVQYGVLQAATGAAYQSAA